MSNIIEKQSCQSTAQASHNAVSDTASMSCELVAAKKPLIDKYTKHYVHNEMSNVP